MMLTPFSFADATEVCEDFEDLIDSEFIMSGVPYIIDAVLVCPSGFADQNLFYNNYIVGQHVDLTADTGTEYDVLLAICNLSTDEPSYLCIREFAAERGIVYKFPKP